MNRLILTIALLLIFIVPQAWGATSPYPNPYRQTTWNSITDTVHTLGQNPDEKKVSIKKLHSKRTNARLKSISQANMAKRKAKRQAWLNGK